ncbi:septation protein SepH [Isoptericola sp. NPDC057391]|uniref:septation protein SepH n=1 Tax=Isoptericola sp. NPDC057391 TaxID=3346117 RepID=UPI0036382C79
MAELELVRLHEDGERLVLRGPDGTESTLPITEALRAAVRRDRPRTEALRAQAATTLRPRDLQARLRAGASVEELAEESGLPVEHVQRYEWPVAAERDHAIGQVRAHRLPGDDDTTTLGEVADTRLAARGVTTDEARWSARRDGTAPWVVEVRFSAGDRDRSARWTFDPKGRVVTPLDDEARWLGQPDDPVSPDVLGVPSAGGRTVPPRRHVDDDTTALLLDDLAGRRGQRPGDRRRTPARATDDVPPPPAPIPVGHVSAPGAPPTGHDAPGGTPEPAHADPAGASVVDLGSRRAGRRPTAPDRSSHPSSHPSAARRPVPGVLPLDRDDDGAEEVDDAADAHSDAHPDARSDVVDDAPAPSGPPTQGAAGPQPAAPAPRSDKPAGARRTGRKGRAQVPSWDEIVFGGGRPSS